MKTEVLGQGHLPLWMVLLALVPMVPPSAQAAEVPPNAGTILQQVQPVVPPVPASSGTGLTIERQGAGKAQSSAPFEVKRIRISGNTLFDTPTLHALVADAEGRTLTLAQLDELAARISEHYRSRGYPLARALIPAQVIRDGVVQINIIEARYGKVVLDNRSAVSGSLLQDTLSALQPGQAIAQAALDRALLLLSDVPGVLVGATLKPGEAVGTSDLLVDAAAGPSVTGNATLDGYGNRFTGRARVGATVNFIEPLGHGDILSVTGLTSGSGLNYGRIAYDVMLNGQGTRLGGAYSELKYVLGGSLAALSVNGTAQVQSVWGKHPLVRSRELNLHAEIQYDRMELRDHIDATGIRTDRHVGNWIASLTGDARDALLAGGINTWNVSWTSGRVGFDNAAAQLADAATAGTERRFSKWNMNLARLQYLGPRSALYLTFSGQWAGANLDAAKKMTAGGPYTVRAYDMGAVSGDSGYVVTAEFRHDLGRILSGQWQAVAFVDSAHVKANEKPWAAGPNTATLSGAGVGLNWSGPDRLSARALIATPVGPVPALVGSTASSRAWIEVGKAF